MTPIATQRAYQPGNGTNADLGSSLNGVAARNFVYLVNASGQGALIGTLINQGDTDATVTITPAAGKATSVAVAAGKTVDFGYNGAAALDLGITAKAGSLASIELASGSDKAMLGVEVLDGTFSEYAGLIPAGPTPAKN